MKARYPFIVSRSKAEVIEAQDFPNALNKILSKHPDKFVKTKYARNVERYIKRINDNERVITTRRKNGVRSASLVTEEDFLEELLPNVTTKIKHKLFMDLVQARKSAAKESKGGKVKYVNVNEEGECLIEDKQDATTFAAFKNGSEIAIETKSKEKSVEEATEPKASKKSNNKTETKMATKTAKKSAKKVSAPVKAKSNGSDKKKVGASFFFDAAQWKQVEAAMKKADCSFNAWANELIFSKVK